MTECIDRTCGNYRLGQPYVKGRDCRRCWNAVNRRGLQVESRPAAAPKASSPPPTPKRTSLPLLPPCTWEGPIVSHCTTCGSKESRHERSCFHPAGERDKCTRGDERSTLQRCNACPQYERDGDADAGPVREVRAAVRDAGKRSTVSAMRERRDSLPPTKRTVVGGLPGHFNAGLIEYRGQLLLASRDRLYGARVHVSILDDDFRPRQTAKLNLSAPGAESGQADSRLHVFRDRLYVAFYGASIHDGRERQKQFYAEVRPFTAAGDIFEAGPVMRPVAPKEAADEKNWSFFECDGEQFAVQWIGPDHVVLRIDGPLVREVYRTPNPLPWSGGERRGGAPPVRVGDEFVSFFHGRMGEDVDAIYSVGVYAFEARPPFRVTRQTAAPLLWATDADRQPNDGCRVIFPQGAVLRDGTWLVSMGAGDQRIEIAEWDAAEVDRRLVSMADHIDGPVKPWPQEWHTSPAVAAEYQRAADRFLEKLEPYPENANGRGIVIAAGGPYWASAYVTVRMLRHVGCTLPVEVWYLGRSGERDERYERLLAPHGVTFHDIDTHPARAGRRVVRGFGTKLFAVVNSRFEEVLCLDPDSYPCADPTSLFEDSEYRRLGGTYWPDLAITDDWTKWKVWGCDRRGPCGLETGQYLVNKRSAWEPLKLAEWYDDHPDLYYGPGNGVPGADYGDKGPHRAAWAKLGRDYAIYATAAVRVAEIAYLQPGPDGSPMFVHRCQSKFSVEPVHFTTTPQHGVNIRAGLPGEDAAFAFLAELWSLLSMKS